MGSQIINQKSKIKNQKFTHAHRLHGNRAFSAVFDAKVRKNAGPLLLFTKPNGLHHWRLGLSVGRRVGNAVTRSKHKRLLREAFRLTQSDWPRLDGGGYDLVIVVRPHELLRLTEYQEKLAAGATAAHRTWAKRRRGDSESS
ncbi:MAG: ribonuclease P protein component [Planctomycetota bacterium]